MLVEAMNYPQGLCAKYGTLWLWITLPITDPFAVSKTVILLEFDPTAKLPLLKLQLQVEFS